MKFKIGDKVRIKSKEGLERKFFKKKCGGKR
jgi:hypothetical protein